MLHQPKPRPPVHPPQQAHHGFQETLDLLVDQSVAICRRLTAQKEAAASPDSPVSTLLREQTKALQESVYCLPTRLLHANLTPGADVPPDIKAQLRTVQQDVFKFLSLDGFYARNPENGRVGGLNALFASKFILENHGATGLTCPSLGPDGAQQILTRLQKIMEAIGPDLSQSTSNDQVIHVFEKHQDDIQAFFSDVSARLDPRYVQTYQRMEDTLYNQNVASSMSKGSFAFVRKVQHKRTGEDLAMKTFFNGSDMSQILHEIGVLEVCNHPNILKLVEAFTVVTDDDDETINIVMSPWAPFTLQKFLSSSEEERRKKCPWFQPGSPRSELCIYGIMRQLADAVAYLHRKSIKHKDIKPENILLHEPGSIPPRAIVADVGVSKVLVHGGSTKYDDCSYPYLAPEQVKKRESSLRADVWQLGCCFAMLLAVSKAGTLGHKKLWDSFCLTKDNRSCQIASELDHFMRTLRDICLPGSRADRAAYSLVASMLDPAHESRIGIEGVLISVGVLIRLERRNEADDRVMTN